MARSGCALSPKRTRPRTPTQLYGRSSEGPICKTVLEVCKTSEKNAAKSSSSLGNGVTVAQQTLTLFVLVRIQVPQPLQIIADRARGPCRLMRDVLNGAYKSG